MSLNGLYMVVSGVAEGESTATTAERRSLFLPGGKRGADQRRLLSRFYYPLLGWRNIWGG